MVLGTYSFLARHSVCRALDPTSTQSSKNRGSDFPIFCFIFVRFLDITACKFKRTFGATRCTIRVGTVRVCTVRVGSIRVGTVRVGSIRVGTIRVGTVRVSNFK